MDDREIICDNHIWTENWFELLICKELFMSIDKLEPFLSDTSYQSKPSFEIFKYLINRKLTLFMDDRQIICDNHIWTEIDLD